MLGIAHILQRLKAIFLTSSVTELTPPQPLQPLGAQPIRQTPSAQPKRKPRQPVQSKPKRKPKAAPPTTVAKSRKPKQKAAQAASGATGKQPATRARRTRQYAK